MALVLAVLLILGAWLVADRRMWALRVFGWTSEPAGLLPAADEGPAVTWVDDYFTVEWLDDATVAIGETRYAQQNFNYLILGRDRAVLFDTGPGVRDIRPVIASLTDLPVTAALSHLHYDHVGNHARFESVAVIDLPYLRARAPEGELTPTAREHLGFVEGVPVTPIQVTEWWAPGTGVELGGRRLEVIHAPGHTEDSMALLDRERNQLFSGDYLYPGPLVVMVPGSSAGDTLRTAEALTATLDPGAAIWGAHRDGPPGAPRLGSEDLEDLRATLEAIREGRLAGSGVFPVVFTVNDRIDLWTDWPRTLRWE